jgi:tartrate dehydratase beta subunit/fumarate hydratase class I family protein
MRGENVVRQAGTVSRDQHSSLRRRSSFHVHVAHSSLICVAARPLIPSTARRWRDTREIPMNVTKVLGLAAVGGLLMLAAPAERAEALSLASPGAAAAVQNDSKQVTTEVHWRHHHYHRRWHHHHRHGHHRHWRHW